MRKFAKTQIANGALVYSVLTFSQMFKISVSATLMHRVAWYRPFQFLFILFMTSDLHLITIATWMDPETTLVVAMTGTTYLS